MNENLPQHDSPNRPNHNLPPVGKGVRVRHQGLECLAYLDGQGKWRNYDNGDLLEGPVTILNVLPFSRL
jgi:hypothetical protein